MYVVKQAVSRVSHKLKEIRWLSKTSATLLAFYMFLTGLCTSKVLFKKSFSDQIPSTTARQFDRGVQNMVIFWSFTKEITLEWYVFIIPVNELKLSLTHSFLMFQHFFHLQV